MEEIKLPQSASTEISVDRDTIPDHALERRALRKCDFNVIPIMVLLSMFTLVDRTNIGNTKIEGILTSLNMKGNDYNVALFVYTIPNAAWQIPNNIFLKKTQHPIFFMSFCLFAWGICTAGQGLTRSYSGLLATRFLNGSFAGGFLSGSAYITSQYYTKNEFLFRYCFLFGGAAIAGAFSGLFAYLLELMDGVGGYEGWRWIFIIEGLITVVVTIPALCFLPPTSPRNARFLNAEEKEFIVSRIEREAGAATMNHVNFRSILRCLGDWKIWVAWVCYMCGDNGASSIAAFQPTILKQLGYTAAEAQLHGLPIYIVALTISMLACFLSSRYKRRYMFFMIGTALATIGWSIELSQVNPVGVRYFGMFALASGIYIQLPIMVGWTIDNVSGSLKQGVATAVVIGLGNLANLVSSNVFITDQAPTYRTGFGTGLASSCLAGVAATVLLVGMWIENGRRDRGKRDYRLEWENVGNLGDDHPNFRYTL